ncbi:hypothetical protein B9Z55_017124 [Caenorhabditis nigoni]|uniref:Uncharacterized protein n=1 Tax=Caenorhabditis nigoni TaxID=1611254 RepID=A0A2G5T846_9PELO|nr:hypothetical protein B9Z55_017124 [Caenorhabditis nigoni]
MRPHECKCALVYGPEWVPPDCSCLLGCWLLVPAPARPSYPARASAPASATAPSSSSFFRLPAPAPDPARPHARGLGALAGPGSRLLALAGAPPPFSLEPREGKN